MTGNKPIDYLDYLLGWAGLNDSLLQAYRNLHLTMQSIFIAIGTGLSLAVLAFNKLIQSTLAILILVALAIISSYISVKMRGIVIARGEEINFWHRKIIRIEQDLPPDRRYFTQREIHYGTDTNHLQELFLTERKISDEEIGLLIKKGLGRKFLDEWLFIGIRIIWLLLPAISIGYTAYCYGCLWLLFLAIIFYTLWLSHLLRWEEFLKRVYRKNKSKTKQLYRRIF